MERALYDIMNPETGVINTVVMTHQEAIRCTNDFEFAMDIIAGQETTSLESIPSDRQHILSDSEALSEAAATSCVVEENVVNVSTETEVAATSSVRDEESPANTVYRWRENNISLLLSIYEEMKEKFADPKISQKKAWMMVAEEANKRNRHFNVTGPQCMTKMRALKKIYKNVKDHNSKSGNDRKTWKYYEKMHEIFGTRAWATPIALVSSENYSASGDAQSNTTAVQMDTHEHSTSTKARDKTTVIELLKAKMEQRERHEAARQQRHEERLASDQELIKTIRDLLSP